MSRYRQAIMVTCLWSCYVLIIVVIEVLKAEPCTDYTETNDTALVTTFEPTNITYFSCPTFAPFKWYRYTGTDDGLLTDDCPEKLQCGSHTQIWINDSFPTVAEGERMTHVCIHKDSSCCHSRNMIRMKNCTDFMVYFFVHTPPCVNYCFYSVPVVDNVNSGSGDNGGSSKESKENLIVAVAVGVSVLALVVIAVIIIFYKQQDKRRIEARLTEDIFGNIKMYDTVQNKRFKRS